MRVIQLTGCVLFQPCVAHLVRPDNLHTRAERKTRVVAYEALTPSREVHEAVTGLVAALRREAPDGFGAIQLRTERDWFDAHCRKPDSCCCPPARLAEMLRLTHAAPRPR